MYFIGGVASGADPLVVVGTSTGEKYRVAHEVPSTVGNSASVVFQVAAKPGAARLLFDVATFVEPLRRMTFPNVLVPRELDFAGLHSISDTEWQLNQRRQHLQWRKAMMDFVASSSSSSSSPAVDGVTRGCKFAEILRLLQASYVRLTRSITTSPPPTLPLLPQPRLPSSSRSRCGPALHLGLWWTTRSRRCSVEAHRPGSCTRRSNSTRVEGGESMVSPEKPLFFKELRRLWTSVEGTMFQKNPLGTGMLIPSWSGTGGR